MIWRVGSMRVRRSYRGGALLEARAGRPAADGDRPEDWIASALPAVNPGLPAEPGEGLTPLHGPDGATTTLAALLAADPLALLGGEHLRAHGAGPGFLAKLLDSAVRLQVQAHPSRDFARTRLGAPHGKLEAYVILAVRPDQAGWIRLGFQRSPGRDGWRRIVARQDLAAMDACFDPIPVQVGETWLVPGGMPHAIGPGVLMLEVMEPSDLVVRCEFAGVPPAGRFMGRDLDLCLDLFDYASLTPAQVRERCRLAAAPAGGAAGEQVLVGPAHTGCFAIRRCRLAAGEDLAPERHGRLALAVVERGRVRLDDGDGPPATLAPLDAALIPAASRSLAVQAVDGPADLLLVQPGA